MAVYRHWSSLLRNILSVDRCKRSMSTAAQIPTKSSSIPRAYVDVIIPVHNSSLTIREAVTSAMEQTIPQHLISTSPDILDVAVCCYDDGSDDNSWRVLLQLQEEFQKEQTDKQVQTELFISSSIDGVARGAGYARNRAAELRSIESSHEDPYFPYFFCLLDSDDVMHETRIAEQVCAMLALPDPEREHTLMGCTFDRDPPDSTWHYAQWANGLTDERLMLERFREVTVLQPTWIMTKLRFQSLGGYVEAPHSNQVGEDWSVRTDETLKSKGGVFRLVHEAFDTPQSLRLAEDLRLFHSHLLSDGLLRLHRTEQPLVTYRHRAGMSQSSQTPRKLLLHLRVLAFEEAVLNCDPKWSGPFVVWGAGRDGKDFVKALSEKNRKRVHCFVDVDDRKIETGYYDYKQMDIRIPIVHFSWLSTNRTETDEEEQFGKIDKRNMQAGSPIDKGSNKRRQAHGEEESSPFPKKRRRAIVPAEVDPSLLSKLPVVVCVAMYRTNGALEANVKSVGRTESKDLWHFS